MKKWFIADTHFSHANIIKYTARPFASVEEMDRILIENWNKCVGDDDQVSFLAILVWGTLNICNLSVLNLKAIRYVFVEIMMLILPE